MTGYYKILETWTAELKAAGFRNVTFGSIEDVDLNRQSIFPLAHIVPDTVNRDGKMTTYTFEILGMDLVDFNKDDYRDMPEPTHQPSNVQDVLNDILIRLSNAAQTFITGNNFDLLMQATGTQDYIPFMERFESLLAGFTFSITIQMPTNTDC